MARLPRLKCRGVDTWYHLYGRIAGFPGEFPLARPLVRRHLMSLIRHYGSIYYCDVAGFSVMGNHYHLIVRFESERATSRDELEARARLMYPGRSSWHKVELWGKEEWEHYRRRLFDVSEFMRNLQSALARWYNSTYGRRGRFWADRFKSVILGDERAVLDCLLYVELNPVRAGLVERPEEWEGSSIFLREIGKDQWMFPIEELMNRTCRTDAFLELKQLLYHRGAVPTRRGQASIPRTLLEQEVARGFTRRGMYRRRLGYFVDGAAIGSMAFIENLLTALHKEGRYLKRRAPVVQLGGIHLSLRQQRSGAGT